MGGMTQLERPWGVSAYGAGNVKAAPDLVRVSQLDLRSEWSYGTPKEFLGYQCTAQFSIESANLDGVQPLLVDLVNAGANEIEKIDFDVTNKLDLRAQARRDAVAAARRKAELYAEAAGVRLGSVLHIEDIDPAFTRAAYASRSSGAGGDSAAALTPGHVVVKEAVIMGLLSPS
jgi:uncharacterized protein